MEQVPPVETISTLGVVGLKAFLCGQVPVNELIPITCTVVCMRGIQDFIDAFGLIICAVEHGTG